MKRSDKFDFEPGRNEYRVEGIAYFGKDNLGYSWPSTNTDTMVSHRSAINPETCIATTSRNEENNATSSHVDAGFDTVPNVSSVPSQNPSSCVGLQKNVNLSGALSLIIGCMIGSGIFASGSTVAMRAGSTGMILCVWSGCGILATFGALCYAELGTAVPKSGSEHAYLSYAFGEIGGFMYTWVSTIVIKPSGQAGICTAFGAYVVEALHLSICETEKNQLVKLFAAFAIGKGSIYAEVVRLSI